MLTAKCRRCQIIHDKADLHWDDTNPICWECKAEEREEADIQADECRK